MLVEWFIVILNRGLWLVVSGDLWISAGVKVITAVPPDHFNGRIRHTGLCCCWKLGAGRESSGLQIFKCVCRLNKD